MLKSIIISIFLFGCTDNTSDNKQVVVKQQKPEDFNIFFAKFKQSKKFQSERITRPLYSYQLEDEINSEKYIPVRISENDLFFDQKDWEEPIVLSIKPLKKNSQEYMVILKGKETGLFIEHHFKLKGNNWYLIKIIDKST